MTTMSHQRPSTPGSNDLFQHGLQHIVQHNANTRRTPTQSGSHLASERADAFYGSSPPTQQQSANAYAHQFTNGQQYPDFDADALGIQFSGLDHLGSEYYQAENTHFNGMIVESQRGATPLTPNSTARDLNLRTRSGRTLNRASSPHVVGTATSKTRVSKSPKVKTPKQKAMAAKTPKIDKPLSELTKDMTHVPVRDIEEWVNRPADVRQKEVEKRNGYVTRPMNSFMLYRSAYAERTKMWCLQNNHQVVSSVSGESWPMEPAEVREQYNEYARIERTNHAKAHPDYKFSPSKGPSASRKKRDDFSDEEDDDDVSNIDPDEDFEWRPRGDRSSRARSSSNKRQVKEASPFPIAYATNSPMQQHHVFDSPYFSSAPVQPSSWNNNTIDRRLPQNQVQNVTDYYSRGPYYQQPDPFQSAPPAQRIPMLYYQNNMMPSGMPGSSYPSDLLELHSHTGTPLPMPMAQFEQQVDPMLLQMDNDALLESSGQELASAPWMDFGDGSGQAVWEGDGAHFDEWLAGREV